MSRRKQIKPQHISNGSDDDDDDDRKLQIDIKEDVQVATTEACGESKNEEPTEKSNKTEEKELDSCKDRESCPPTKSSRNSKSKDLNRSPLEDENKESKTSEQECSAESKKLTKQTGFANESPKRCARNSGISSSKNVIVTRTVARLRQQGKCNDAKDEKRKNESDSDADESDQDDVESWTPEKLPSGKTLRSGRKPMPADNSRLQGRTCEYCGAVKPTPAALQRHLRKHTGERPFVCKVCSKAYKAKRSLQLHLLSNHPEVIDKTAPLHIKHDTTAQLREVLEQKIKQDKSLVSVTKKPVPDPTEHSISNDTQSPSEKVIDTADQGCDVLSYAVEDFSTSGSNHVMNRTCKYCGKICLKPSDLKRHVLLHTGDKPYTCEVCGKSFKAKGSMLYHQKAAHNMNVELSQSLAERYMKLKNRSYEKSLYVQEKIAEYQQQMLNGSVKEELDESSLLDNSHETDPVPNDVQSNGDKSKGHNSSGDRVGSVQSESHSELLSNLDNSGLLSSVDGTNLHLPSFLDRTNSSFAPVVNRQFSSTSEGSVEGAVHNSHEDVGDAVGTVVTGDGPFMKSRIRIRNETVLITRLDGVNLSTDKDTSMYKCYICGTMLSSLSNVQVHLSMHFDLEITTYQCRHCDATFESKHQMLQHVLSHKIMSNIENKERLEEELNEGRLLMEENEEELRESIETSKKPKLDINENSEVPSDVWLDKCGVRLVGNWECKYCRKSFSRLYLLQRHERIHNGQKMFYCKECRKGFSESVNLHQHMVRFHHIPKTIYGQVESVLPRKLDKANLRSLMRIAYWDKFSDQTTHDNNSEQFNTTEDDQRLKDLERAKEFLEKQGIQDDITVVMPSEPPTEHDHITSNSQHSASNHASDSAPSDAADPEDPEIKAAPKRSLMSFRKEGPPTKSRRKASLPVKLDSVEPTCSNHVDPAAPTPATSAASEMSAADSRIICAEEIKQEVVDPGDSKEVTHPISHASVLNTVLSGSTALASLNPLILASTVASAQSAQLLTSSGLVAGLPATGYASNSMVAVPMAISVQVTESQSVGKSSSPSRSSSSPCQASPADPDSLVGFPRVQWNPSPTDSSSGPSPTDGRKLPSWQIVDGISSDGRKVTSLSRTHSRLHVVNQPIDRDMVCKPVVLPDGRAVFRCVFCAKDFLSFSDINRHMDFHEDIRPYKCKYCDYYARTNSQLKVHMMRHQGIRDFCCKLCNYKGVTQSDLNRHMKSQIHLLKSQNQCQHCGEGFVTARNLEKHLDGNCVVKVHDLDTTD